VLVPVDFTQDDCYLLDFAEGLPRIGVTRAVLAHVLDASGMEGPVIAAKVDNVRARMCEQAELLKAVGLEIECEITTGEAAREILLLGMQMRVDAILMASHAKHVIDELLTGSVSEAVLVESTVPVMVVRYDLVRNTEDPTALLGEFSRKMLVPTDFSAWADRAFDAAVDIAKAVPLCGIDRDEPCGVLALHVVDRSVGEDRIADAEHEAATRLAELVERAAEQGVPASYVVAVGDVKRVIVDAIHDRRATGVVIGSRGVATIAEAFVGSIAKTVARQASCPVLAVP
jgi:nucleotide-binding universal stress UspA family protein